MFLRNFSNFNDSENFFCKHVSYKKRLDLRKLITSCPEQLDQRKHPQQLGTRTVRPKYLKINNKLIKFL